jgi:hypothetical protein
MTEGSMKADESNAATPAKSAPQRSLLDVLPIDVQAAALFPLLLCR